MTNEELVMEIQQGHREKLLDLWEQVERYVRVAAQPVIRALEGNPVCDIDDLMQAGYLVLEDAAMSFDSSGDYKFTTYLRFKLKNAFAEATGFRTKAQKEDPLRNAISLDSPRVTADSENDCCLMDLIPDPFDYAEQLEDQDYEAWKTATIRQEVDNLPDDEMEVIQRRYFSGDTQKDIAESLKLSPQRISQLEKRALQKLKERKILQDIAGYVDRHTDYYRRVGVQTFHRNGLSAVEEIVFSRERLRKQRTAHWERIMKNQDAK